jgi:hypothetical protein
MWPTRVSFEKVLNDQHAHARVEVSTESCVQFVVGRRNFEMDARKREACSISLVEVPSAVTCTSLSRHARAEIPVSEPASRTRRTLGSDVNLGISLRAT